MGLWCKHNGEHYELRLCVVVHMAWHWAKTSLHVWRSVCKEEFGPTTPKLINQLRPKLVQVIIRRRFLPSRKISFTCDGMWFCFCACVTSHPSVSKLADYFWGFFSASTAITAEFWIVDTTSPCCVIKQDGKKIGILHLRGVEWPCPEKKTVPFN